VGDDFAVRAAMPSPAERSPLERFLSLFADVRPGEGVTVVLLALNVFLLLLAYYVLKPVREALVLSEGSAELKSYLSAGQVVVLALVVPLYGRLVSAVSRIRLINTVTLAFAACPVGFFMLAKMQVPIAIPFFIWIGIFSLMIVAQFWAFANDIYSKDQGERLFAIVGFGASLGAVAGARIADRLIGPFEVEQLMLVGAAVLIASLMLTNRINRDNRQTQATPRPAAGAPRAAGGNAFALVLRTRFLLLMGLMLMLVNLVNTTGEYILGSIVTDTASAMIASGRNAGLSEEQLIGDFYSKYFTLVNIIGLLLQLFVVARLVKRFGVGASAMVLPVIALCSYGIMMLVPTLWMVLGAKVAENSTDYSLNNTVRNMLFLPCSYEEKFSGKQVIDSFFVRMGDVLSALLVFIGSSLALGPRRFAAINAALVVVWLLIAWRTAHHYRLRSAASVATS